MVTIASLAAASAPMPAPALPPPAASLSTATLVTSWPATGWPALTRLSAMGSPMLPRPMKPMRITSSLARMFFRMGPEAEQHVDRHQQYFHDGQQHHHCRMLDIRHVGDELCGPRQEPERRAPRRAEP